MTRKLLWLLLGGVLAGGAAMLVTGRAFQDSDREQIAALAAELAQVKAGLNGVAGTMHRAGARAGAAAAASPTLPSFVGSPGSAGAAPASAEPAEHARELTPEEQARVDREHHDRLDALARKGGSASVPTALLRTNVDAILARQAARTAGLSVESLECSADLCRVAMRIPAAARRAALRELYGTLAQGMSEMTMRPFDGDRAVFYLAPAGHRLPSAN